MHYARFNEIEIKGRVGREGPFIMNALHSNIFEGYTKATTAKAMAKQQKQLTIFISNNNDNFNNKKQG